MNSITTTHNPIARAALALPPWLGLTLARGGRLAGIALAASIALDQSYDRTRAVSIAFAVPAAASLLPLPSRLAARLMWTGAGVLFFGGALLAGSALGLLMAVAGAVAAAGAAIDDRQRERVTGVPSFFTGFGLVAAITAAAVLGIEG
jgi:hypothetical protein